MVSKLSALVDERLVRDFEQGRHNRLKNGEVACPPQSLRSRSPGCGRHGTPSRQSRLALEALPHHGHQRGKLVVLITAKSRWIPCSSAQILPMVCGRIPHPCSLRSSRSAGNQRPCSPRAAEPARRALKERAKATGRLPQPLSAFPIFSCRRATPAAQPRLVVFAMRPMQVAPAIAMCKSRRPGDPPPAW